MRRSTMEAARALLMAGVVLAGIGSAAYGQSNDPRSDPFPILDYGDPAKTIVVELRFDDRFDVTIQSVEVVPERTRGLAGDPPLLMVEVMDLDGEVVETFNAWHPQWVFVENAGGGESLIIQQGAVGRILCPFAPGLAEMRITDMAAEMEMASVDLLPAVHDFCRESSEDPDCQDVANREPVCDAGGPYIAECNAPIALDGLASFDPDMDSFSYEWNGAFVGGTATEPTPTVTFAQLGATVVDLDLEDEFGGLSICDADVGVVDTTLPTIDCNNAPSFERPGSPVTFQALADDSCDGATIPAITDFECFKTNPNGKKIDATHHCRVDLLGDRIRIDGVGLPGVTVRWTVVATDQSGNSISAICMSTA